jgi:lysozyme
VNISPEGIEFLKQREGLKLSAYLCSGGVWTIGYGTTKGIKQGMTITEQEAEELFQRDLEKFVSAVRDSIHVRISQCQFDALVSFAYNVGVGPFKRSTLLREVNSLRFGAAADEFGRWIYASGGLNGGLVNRRKLEQELFLSC